MVLAFLLESFFSLTAVVSVVVSVIAVVSKIAVLVTVLVSETVVSAATGSTLISDTDSLNNCTLVVLSDKVSR